MCLVLWDGRHIPLLRGCSDLAAVEVQCAGTAFALCPWSDRVHQFGWDPGWLLITLVKTLLSQLFADAFVWLCSVGEVL